MQRPKLERTVFVFMVKDLAIRGSALCILQPFCMQHQINIVASKENVDCLVPNGNTTLEKYIIMMAKKKEKYIIRSANFRLSWVKYES